MQLVAVSPALSRLPPFSTGFRSELPVLGKAAIMRRYRSTALAAGFRSEVPVLRETALVVGYIGTALARDLTLLVLVHCSEPAPQTRIFALMSHELGPPEPPVVQT